MKRASKTVTDDLIGFTQHLASAVKMKLPLVSTLEVMEKEAGTKPFSRVVQDITTKVEQGMALSKALEYHPEEFSEYYRRMVAAGEEGQTLGEILEQLANYLESSYKINKKIRSAFAYPSIVGVLVVLDMFLAGAIGIFPRYKAIYDEMGANVNILTAIVISVGDKFFYILGTFLLIIGIAVGVFFLTGYYRSGKGKITRDKLLIHFPLIGLTARKAAAAQFSRTLSSLLKGGVALPDALKLTANTTSNEVVRQAVLSVHEKVLEGENMGTRLSETEIFPQTMVWMISQGEEKGELINTLDHLANFYDIQVESSIHVATSVFEPFVIIILGILVTFFVAALYLPLFNIVQIIR